MECFKPALSRGEHWPDKRVCIIRNDGNWIKGVMHMRCVIDANNYTYMFKRLSSGNVKLKLKDALSVLFESELCRGKPNVAPTNVFVSFRISVTSDKSTRVVD